ncbi:uncharacterized protein CIMG_07184 [Coccidioides immitis RS]|uniref:Uncharacterized protein n=1 Tax=Coccidioides immitis (strain RS) TaxID=246410 RepID=A0A0E1S2B1_COCIM|nr:uncharacterized protein CIMG_07184 [Coccidioides immitis RS]EAS31705.2 hypothetical protein CIMG_07184 [Coccidioides immitis RS]
MTLARKLLLQLSPRMAEEWLGRASAHPLSFSSTPWPITAGLKQARLRTEEDVRNFYD